jgi:NADP-dependent 3-hydroxy acid dehydrogenase YdfG
MLKKLDGLVGVVSGAGTEIGAAVARELGNAGMRLVLVGSGMDPLAECSAGGGVGGGDLLAISAEASDHAAVDRAVGQAVERWGRLDVLVQDADVADVGPMVQAGPVLQPDAMETKLLGVIFAVRAALPHMKARGAGHIVIVSSESGRVTRRGEPAYVASSGGIAAFMDCLRRGVAPAGIRVSLIEPGLVETPLIHVYPEVNHPVPGVIPLDPDDIARAVKYVVEQPDNVNVFEMMLRPTGQLL